MSPKQKVRTKYPFSFATKDVDGFWHVYTADLGPALSGGQQDTKSATEAWKRTSERLNLTGVQTLRYHLGTGGIIDDSYTDQEADELFSPTFGPDQLLKSKQQQSLKNKRK